MENNHARLRFRRAMHDDRYKLHLMTSVAKVVKCDKKSVGSSHLLSE